MGDVIRLIVLLWSAAVVVVAAFFGMEKGHAILYPSVAILAILLSYGTYYGIALLTSLCRPPFPRCKTGKCAGVGYYRYLGTEGDLKKYQCECGVEYLLSRHGELKVVEQGKGVPFMCHSRFGRWRPCS